MDNVLSTIECETADRVLLITLNRPERLNALNQEMNQELTATLNRAAQDDAVAAVVITGAGRAFSAGADLEVFAAMAASSDPAPMERFTDPAFPRAFTDFPKPLIAAINGPAVGWGFTMPLLCDLRLASEDAVLSLPFLRVGVTPEFVSTFFLPRLVGLGRAMELVLTGRQITAAEALDMGLVNRVCPAGELVDQALALARSIGRQPAPALAMAKEAMLKGAQSGLTEVIEREVEFFRRALASPEHKDALKQVMALVKDKV